MSMLRMTDSVNALGNDDRMLITMIAEENNKADDYDDRSS